MLNFSPWKTTLILLTLLAGILFAAPNFLPQSTLDRLPGFMPTQRINLGLDLQGGVYLLLEVEAEQVVQERLQSLVDDVRQAMRGERGGAERIRISGLALSGSTISLTVVNGEDVEEAMRRLRRLAEPVGGLGGPPNIRVSRNGQQVSIVLTEEAQNFMRDSAVRQAVEVVRRRIDALGTREPAIQRQGSERIVVQVPGESDPERIKDLIGRTAKLSFHMVDSSVSIQDALAGRIPPGSELLPSDNPAEPYVLIRSRADITGDMLTGASAGPAQDQVGFQVNFQMDTRGARRFADITRENVGRRFAIVLDGRVISAPVIQSPIPGGSGRITGNFDAASANDLAILLRAGALPADLNTLEQRSVGPDLGRDSIEAGARALAIGFAAVIVYMMLSYGVFGVFANLALIFNVALIAGALSALQATLTLPGIAGIVLTIGMAVDANVLIFERIREELANGKTPVAAIEKGYGHALSAILDANITTLIATIILFLLGSGPIRGFAVTLSIGVFTSVFTAFVVSRLIVAIYVRSARPKAIAL
ncbi:MAG: protein translocase subunit SecD [Parvularculaceae bacterium]